MILPDGTRIVDMMRAYETRLFTGNNEADLASNYWYLHQNYLIEYLEDDDFDYNHRLSLLSYTCLDEDCWPLVCSMEKRDDYIIWHEFFQPHRRQWDYSGFGPFGFKKRQLAEALSTLGQEYENLQLLSRADTLLN